jgi:hypothetical protein
MCSILWWILYIWEAICWNFSHFALFHALSTRGRSLCMIWAPGSFWKVFHLVRENFEQFGAGLVTWGGLTAPQAARCVVGGLTAWWRRSNHPGQSEQIFALCCIPVLHCCICLGEVCFGSGGACICAGGALCGVRALVWWFALFAWAWFCLGCVEPLPLPKGSETCLLQVILFFAFIWISIACWGFFLFVYFLILFSLVTNHVCCQCTHQWGDWGPCVVRGPVDGHFLVWW